MPVVQRSGQRHERCATRGRAPHRLGHKRIALVNGPTALTPCAERRSSFLEVLAEHGLALKASHDLEQAEMTIEAGEQAAHKLLNARSLPTAVFCTNDLLALGMERGR